MKIVLVLLTLVILVTKLNAQEDNTIKKANFILDVASKIHYPEASGKETYKIGIYGKGSEIRELVNELEKLETSHKIKGKPFQVYRFKTTKRVQPVDLLFIHGNSKIRIGDLKEKLSGHPYIIVTENFPYGTSMLNFAFSKKNKLIYELQSEILRDKGAVINDNLLKASNRTTTPKQWEKMLDDAIKMIQKQKQKIKNQTDTIVGQESTIIGQENTIVGQENTIENQEHTIEGQEDEIDEKSKTIGYQRAIIALAVVSIILISVLVGFLLRLYKDRKQALAEVTASIKYAQHIQNAMLPPEKMINQYLPNNFVLFKPKHIVSGDFYWLEVVGDKVFFAAADCTGHGVPGAMLSILCSNALTKVVKELGIHEPADILEKTSEIIENNFSKSEREVTDGMDLALCCIDRKEKTMSYAGAKNPLYYIENGELKVIKGDRRPIGKFHKPTPYTSHTIDIIAGQVFYVFSDGLPDQFGGENDKKFTYKRFRELLISIHKMPVEEQKATLNKTIEEWKGANQQTDDICVWGIQIE